MRVIIFSLLLFNFCSCQNNTQQKPLPYSFQANWEAGDQWEYFHSQSKIKQMGQASDVFVEMEQILQITVLEKRANQYLLQWKIKELLPNDYTTNKQLEEYHEFIKDYKILYKTDFSGKFSELVNWEEVRDHNLKIMGLALAEDSLANPQKYAETKRIVQSLFSTKEQLEQLIMDVRLFHQFYSIEGMTHQVDTLSKPFTTVLADEAFYIPVAMEVIEMDTFNKVFKGEEYFYVSDTSKNSIMPKILGQLKRKFPPGRNSSKVEKFPFSILFATEFSFDYQEGIFDELHIIRSTNATLDSTEFFNDREYKFTRW